MKNFEAHTCFLKVVCDCRSRFRQQLYLILVYLCGPTIKLSHIEIHVLMLVRLRVSLHSIHRSLTLKPIGHFENKNVMQPQHESEVKAAVQETINVTAA